MAGWPGWFGLLFSLFVAFSYHSRFFFFSLSKRSWTLQTVEALRHTAALSSKERQGPNLPSGGDFV
jgi:hypothetical protein